MKKATRTKQDKFLAQMVQEFLEEDSSMMPSELSRRAKEDYGALLSPNYAAVLRSKYLRGRNGQSAITPAVDGMEGDEQVSLTALRNFTRSVQALGGIETARRLLDMISQ